MSHHTIFAFLTDADSAADCDNPAEMVADSFADNNPRFDYASCFDDKSHEDFCFVRLSEDPEGFKSKLAEMEALGSAVYGSFKRQVIGAFDSVEGLLDRIEEVGEDYDRVVYAMTALCDMSSGEGVYHAPFCDSSANALTLFEIRQRLLKLEEEGAEGLAKYLAVPIDEIGIVTFDAHS